MLLVFIVILYYQRSNSNLFNNYEFITWIVFSSLLFQQLNKIIVFLKSVVWSEYLKRSIKVFGYFLLESLKDSESESFISKIV